MDTRPLPKGRESLLENMDLKNFVEELRKEWKSMWRSRIEDEVRAEGIADKTYERLFVDRGMILIATRKYKPPDFQEILENHLSPEEISRYNPNPIFGGIRKFIREFILLKNERREAMLKEMEKMKKHTQLKKDRGWLHLKIRN